MVAKAANAKRLRRRLVIRGSLSVPVDNTWLFLDASGSRSGRPLVVLIKRDGELVGIELPQILNLLPDPDVAHGNGQFVANTDDHAALGRPVELGEDDPGQRHR